MKRLYIILFSWLFPLLILAQAPGAFNYQAVVRDQAGQILAGKSVNFRISLLKDSEKGIIVYSETNLALTNEFGLVNLEIGHGTAITGDFSKVDWSVNNYYLEVEADMEGGTDFKVLGISRLLSVPYAMYAKSSGNSFSGNYNDLQNKPVYLSSFINDAGFLTLKDLQGSLTGDQTIISSPGVPAQAWSLFGNSGTNPAKDKIGNIDSVDLIMVTNNLERIRIQADGDLELQKNLSIAKDVTMGKNVSLNSLGGSTQNFGPFTVANSSTTNLTGIVNINGAANLNNTLNIDSATFLHNTLQVDGFAFMSSGLHIDSAISINGSLDAAGPTMLASTLSVMGKTTLIGDLHIDSAMMILGPLDAAGATTLTNTLSVTGVTTLNSTLGANGQVTINASLAGGDGAFDAYPLRVEGSDQGIAVKVNGTRDNSKNFMTFWDDNGRQGRIEGQTTSELHGSFDYIWFQTQQALQTAFQVAMVVVDIAGVDDIDASVVEGVEMVDIISNWGVMAADMDNNAGVAFESGSGDYAEWLRKSNSSESFSYGDIVGVNGSGISKSSVNPDLFMVISMSPIILGNMPPQGQEALYEKVAFMGQVPVKVRGKVETGDYILASGLDDGFGIAVHPDEMKTDQYKKIVGVAWSASPGNAGFSYINTAVGIHTGELAAEITRQQAEIESVKANMNSIVSYLKAKDPGFDATIFETGNQVAPVPDMAVKDEKLAGRVETTNRLVTYLEERPEMLQQIMADARNLLDKRGIDYNKFEQTRRLVTDKSYFIDILKSSANN